MAVAYRRVTVGMVLVGSVLYGHWSRGWQPVAWLLGWLVFPAGVVAGLWWRGRHRPLPLRATGPVGQAVNLAAFLAAEILGSEAA